jgi:hypothetical protein
VKSEARADVKAFMVVDDGPVLVNLMGKYVSAVFLDAGDDKTYVIRVVQYDERERERGEGGGVLRGDVRAG